MYACPDLATTVRAKALHALSAWAVCAERHWWNDPEASGRGCFGTGYDNWGVQTNQKYLAAMAVLATDPDTDPADCSVDPALVLERALAALRYSLDTYTGGERTRTDGTQWGGTWISSLGIERMMHGVEALDEHLTDRDREMLRRMITGEAEAQLVAEVAANRWQSTHRNRPESNLWNGAILARAAMMYPDHPHADDWREKANLFLLNGVSVPADAEDGTVIAGKPLSEWHVGANFFPHYALDHHGYLNVGYMVICLSNIAMLHYGFVARGEEPPPALYHHAEDLWSLLRRLVAPNGRLLRIGGDTRQRYCYCQDYLLPTLVWTAHHLGDAHAMGQAEGAIDTILREQDYNADGSFVGARLSHIAQENPYYYTRLESDKAVVLSMLLRWTQQFAITGPAEAGEDLEGSVRGGWHEPEHGAVFHRSPTRLASWSWRAAERPQGLCVPPDRPHMAEWQENLAGRACPVGATGRRELKWERTQQFPGGFVTIGCVNEGSEVHVPEGWRRSDLVRHAICFAALPDDHSVARLELARIGDLRLFFRNVEGVSLRIANDVFNEMKRFYHTPLGTREVAGIPERAELREFGCSWVNVDDCLGLVGIYGGDSWYLLREPSRAGGYSGSIYSDRLCYPSDVGPTAVQGPRAVLDTGCVLLSSVDTEGTQSFFADDANRRLECEEPDGRALLVRGQDGVLYLVAANFSSSVHGVTPSGLPAGRLTDLAAGKTIDVPAEGPLRLPVAPQSAAVYRLDA